MSEAMDIDGGYEARDREASPRRDRAERSPRRYSDNGHSNRRGEDSFRDRPDSAGSSAYKSDRNYSNSVFVGNIPFDCEPSNLKELFSGAGNVIRADIVTQNGRHRGMATVEFSSKGDVDKAIRNFNHTNFMDREIFVRQDNPPPQSRGPPRDSGRGRDWDRGFDRRGSDRSYGRGYDRGYDRGDSRRDDYGRGEYGRGDYGRGGYGRGDYGRGDYGRGGYERDERRGDYGRSYPPRREERPARTGPIYEVFVGNLPFSVNWQALKDTFREVGNVVRSDVRLDERGRSKGFGTVSFETAEDVERAIEKLNGTEIEGRRIDVREGKHNTKSTADGEAAPVNDNNSEFVQGVGPNGEQNDTIYVDNLPFATSNDDLFELFETVGRVSKAEVIYTSTGRSAGAAVVQFETEDSAVAAISSLNGYDYGGRSLAITYARKA